MQTIVLKVGNTNLIVSVYAFPDEVLMKNLEIYKYNSSVIA
jgi:hypothetical protein